LHVSSDVIGIFDVNVITNSPHALFVFFDVNVVETVIWFFIDQNILENLNPEKSSRFSKSCFFSEKYIWSNF
jgi:hypothetical protein